MIMTSILCLGCLAAEIVLLLLAWKACHSERMLPKTVIRSLSVLCLILVSASAYFLLSLILFNMDFPTYILPGLQKMDAMFGREQAQMIIVPRLTALCTACSFYIWVLTSVVRRKEEN